MQVSRCEYQIDSYCFTHSSTQYIPIGTMKLDLSWFPLAQFLEDKFKWADMIANTKQIRLSIQDNTVSTAAGIQKLLELSFRDTSTLSTDLVVRDIEGGATIVSSSHGSKNSFNYLLTRGE